jgi:hypothetical protein
MSMRLNKLFKIYSCSFIYEGDSDTKSIDAQDPEIKRCSILIAHIHLPVYFKSSLDYLQYSIQCK